MAKPSKEGDAKLKGLRQFICYASQLLKLKQPLIEL
jgi:hypothetical protein